MHSATMNKIADVPGYRSPFRYAPVSLTLTLPVPHVDLGAGLLQYADNRPTVVTLVEMVAVGMVPAPRRSRGN